MSSPPSNTTTRLAASFAGWAVALTLLVTWWMEAAPAPVPVPTRQQAAPFESAAELTVGDEAALVVASSQAAPLHADAQVVPVDFEAPGVATLPAPTADATTLPPPTSDTPPPGTDEPAPEQPSPEGPVMPARVVPARVVVPMATPDALDGTVDAEGDLVSIAVREAPLHAVLSLLARQQGLSIVASSELDRTITVTLQPTSLDNALDALLAIADCTWARRNDVIYVTSLSPTEQAAPSPFFQGRELRVYTLNYAAATDMERVVAGLLSSVGSVYVKQFDARDQRKTSEQLVVEDLPPFLERIEQYLSQADVCPRQVLIEARLLQVRLGKDRAHGVNFDALARVSGARVQLATTGFASDAGPGMVFTIDGSDYNSLIDCLTTTTDSKTLASPKVFAVNGQQARIQIGERLGYFVTTTTQTATVQNVDFLEVGVVLDVLPQITADGQVLMQVQPKVSTGAINPTTGLPDEETTEVTTSVLVPDGHGVIIGGLIQEEDIVRESKLGPLGDLWGVGRLFQRRTVDRERNEVIVALRPRIVECGACQPQPENVELARSQAPLLTRGVTRAPRPWEPRLRDASDPPPRWSRKAQRPGAVTVVQAPPERTIDAQPTPVRRLPPVEVLSDGPSL